MPYEARARRAGDRASSAQPRASTTWRTGRIETSSEASAEPAAYTVVQPGRLPATGTVARPHERLDLDRVRATPCLHDGDRRPGEPLAGYEQPRRVDRGEPVRPHLEPRRLALRAEPVLAATQDAEPGP